MNDLPASVAKLSQNVLPLLHRQMDGQRMAAFVHTLVAHERWNSFDRFHDAARTVAAAYAGVGARVETYAAPTGGGVGTGRWLIQEAMDVQAATLDLLEPEAQRVLDYRQNPWHVVQWTTGTPSEGIVCDLVAVDSQEELARLRPGALAGKMVLTRLDVGLHRVHFCEMGAVGILSDVGVKDCPDAVAWAKFGWGGLKLQHAAARLIGLVISANQGKALRELLAVHKKLKVKVQVDVRRYTGTHDVVSGLIPGRDDPQSEVWAVAHTHEPGALDNASGVALCVEIARVLNTLIAGGQLQRPRRTIRLLHGYECYGFFHYLEHQKRFETPLAGICIDTVGARPDLCGGKIGWHQTVPASAGFVDDVGLALLEAALKLDSAGYTLEPRPFRSTDDTLLGDPRYGFPCPWLTNHPCLGYHSSADTVEMLHPAGLATCAAMAAAYLYYLADAATPEAMELVRWQTARTVAQLRTPSPRLTASIAANWQTARTAANLRTTGLTSAQGRFELQRHAINLDRLQRWLWGGQRSEIMAQLAECERQVADAARRLEQLAAPAEAELRLIPIRRALLTPTPENTWPPIAEAIVAAPKWSHFWADGARSLAEIADLLATELNQPVDTAALIAFFRALAELGYVELQNPEQMISQERLVADLRALGLRAGMDVMVHSSLSSLGPVRGGAATVVEAILAAISPGGTLLAPSFNHFWAAVYNPLATRSTNGAIPDALWRRPDAMRSLNSSHAVAAVGPKAEHYTTGHLAAGVWGEQSPIGRLVHGGGYILSLGVKHDATTAYHTAEVSLGVGCLDQFGSQDRIVNGEGMVQIVPSLAWRSQECPVDPLKIGDLLDQRGQQAHGQVGAAAATLAKAIDIFNTRREQLRGVCATCMIRPNRRPVTDRRTKV